MHDLIEKLVAHVTALSNTTETFVHRSWFVEHHLRIVEKIAMELCEKYPQADKDLVRVMAWMHDYGKIIDFANQKEVTLKAGRACLNDMGFPPEFIEKTFAFIDVVDKKEGLAAETIPIEIKIMSSADGAAHLVGPFFFLYWYENADKPYKDLMAENRRKTKVDWEKKIVLPEVKEAFKARRDFFLEQIGTIPERFF